MRVPIRALALGAVLLATQPVLAEDTPTPKTVGPAPKIQWFGTWESAKAEAKRTGRPILLTSAAPQCKGTPGIW